MTVLQWCIALTLASCAGVALAYGVLTFDEWRASRRCRLAAYRESDERARRLGL